MDGRCWAARTTPSVVCWFNSNHRVRSPSTSENEDRKLGAELRRRVQNLARLLPLFRSAANRHPPILLLNALSSSSKRTAFPRFPAPTNASRLIARLRRRRRRRHGRGDARVRAARHASARVQPRRPHRSQGRPAGLCAHAGHVSPHSALNPLHCFNALVLFL